MALGRKWILWQIQTGRFGESNEERQPDIEEGRIVLKNKH
jgi:hypothetical protein